MGKTGGMAGRVSLLRVSARKAITRTTSAIRAILFALYQHLLRVRARFWRRSYNAAYRFTAIRIRHRARATVALLVLAILASYWAHAQIGEVLLRHVGPSDAEAIRQF